MMGIVNWDDWVVVFNDNFTVMRKTSRKTKDVNPTISINT